MRERTNSPIGPVRINKRTTNTTRDEYDLNPKRRGAKKATPKKGERKEVFWDEVKEKAHGDRFGLWGSKCIEIKGKRGARRDLEIIA